MAHDKDQVTSKLEELFISDAVDLRRAEAQCYAPYETYIPVDGVISLLAGIEDRSRTFNEIVEMAGIDFRDNPVLFLTLEAFYPHWVDVDAVMNRADNQLLNEGIGWQGRFSKQLAIIVANSGNPVAWDASNYGWRDWDWTRSGEEIIAVFNTTEDHWDEFVDTFATEDNSLTGITAEVVYTDGVCRNLRVVGSMSHMMAGMV